MNEGEVPSGDIAPIAQDILQAPEVRRSPKRLRMFGASIAAVAALTSACDMGTTDPEAIQNYTAAESEIAGALAPISEEISKIKLGQIPDSKITYTGAEDPNDPNDPFGTKTVTVRRDGKDCTFTIMGILPRDEDHAVVTSLDPVTGMDFGGFSYIRGIGVETRDEDTGTIVTSVNADMQQGTLVMSPPEGGRTITYRSNPNKERGEQQLTDSAIREARGNMSALLTECTVGGQG